MARVVNERQYPVRLPPDEFAEVERQARERRRSINWVLQQIVHKALADKDWLREALRQDPPA